MIIVKIYGGMANQLFQYAAGYALAKYHNVALKLDISYFQEMNEDTKREFELSKFPIDYTIATQEEIDQVFKFRSMDYAWNKLIPLGKKRFYGEKKPGYYDSFFNLGDTVYLRGYFQSEKYFAKHKQLIIEQFKINTVNFKHLLPQAQTLSNSNSVALHIRLGDYLNPTLSGIMAPFNLDYYKKAIALIKQKISNPSFYIFSDQINLAKELLDVEIDAIYVDASISKNADQDFFLMQSCQHQIITNSSFSWWAAYLNQYPQKIVIAPQKWYKDHFGDATNLFPDNWVVL
jgi:hypothetical protein